MIRIKPLFSACLLWPLFIPAPVSALSVEIQGTRLSTEIEGGSCIEIAGSYPGLLIEPSEWGKSPRICYNNSNQVNSISILNSTFIAPDPIHKIVIVRFEHDFPPGINGKIMSRAKLQGFFSTPNGVDVPSGDRLTFSTAFSQNYHDDAIAEPFDMTVGDGRETALFDFSAKEQYLASGSRVLKGSLKIYFSAPGHRLTLADKSGIVIDTGSTMADKLESMQPEEPAMEEGGEKTSPTPPTEEPKQEKPKSPIPFPVPGGTPVPPPQ